MILQVNFPYVGLKNWFLLYDNLKIEYMYMYMYMYMISVLSAWSTILVIHCKGSDLSC